MKKNFRYLILLLILLFVATNEALTKLRSTSWEIPLRLHIYAINGDDRKATETYISSLKTRDFKAIENFVNREATRYGVKIDALEVEYRGLLQSDPPIPPSGRSIPENIWWSMKFRAWAAHRAWNSDDDANVTLFVSYFDTETSQSLPHSVGLEGGKIGIINAFADRSYQGSNNVVITHEFMHTLGAPDQYAAGNLPLHPEGYAEPYRNPLYPQRLAEIMGGRIPISQNQHQMPDSLKQVVVGIYTAAEINWPLETP